MVDILRQKNTWGTPRWGLCLLVLIALISVVSVLPRYSDSDCHWRISPCRSHLISFYYCALDHAEMHNGQFPTVDETRMMFTADNLKCAEAREFTSLVYVPNQTKTSPPNNLLLYDPAMGHSSTEAKRALVLYVDGSGKSLDANELVAAIQNVTRQGLAPTALTSAPQVPAPALKASSVILPLLGVLAVIGILLIPVAAERILRMSDKNG